MLSSLDRRDLLDARYRECGRDPGNLTHDCARLVLGLHAGHGPGCAAYLGALRSLSTVLH